MKAIKAIIIEALKSPGQKAIDRANALAQAKRQGI